MRIWVALFLLASVAHAQPMMIDPSKMSGIPRPDPQVPAKTITVRLIRGELANRIVGNEVELTDGKKTLKAKTDAEGRATFANLSGGPFVAHAHEGDMQLESQPIELPGDAGVRVMLVFPKPGAAEEPGTAHNDKAIPALTIIVHAQDGNAAPLANLEVVLAQARTGEDNVHEVKAKTNAQGDATFAQMDAKPTSGYQAEVVRDNLRFSSKPFRLTETMGARVTIVVEQASADASALRFGDGTHFQIEVGDDVLRVKEVLRLENATDRPINAGTIHIPLPEKALSAQVFRGAPGELSVTGHMAEFKGAVPVGVVELPIVFALAFDGGTVILDQRTPIPIQEMGLITEDVPGVSVIGHDMHSKKKAFNGHNFVIYQGTGTKKDGAVHIEFTGLPHSDPTLRLVAALGSLAIFFGFLIYAFRGRGSRSGHRDRLAEERERLLSELAALELKGQESDKAKRRREELRVKLIDVYRQLDEVNA